MKLVKEYLEKRIEQLTEAITIDGVRLQGGNISVLIEELEQVLTLFNEEYKENEETIKDLNDYISILKNRLLSKNGY